MLTFVQHKIIHGANETEWFKAVQQRLGKARADGQRIIFTSGCFDILHRGHAETFARARGLGDMLVVGLNTDASVRRGKGPTRPVNPLEDRMFMAASQAAVDLVLPFDGDTADDILAAVRPHAFVKSGEWTKDTVKETRTLERYGIELVIAPIVPGRSTTIILERGKSRT